MPKLSTETKLEQIDSMLFEMHKQRFQNFMKSVQQSPSEAHRTFALSEEVFTAEEEIPQFFDAVTPLFTWKKLAVELDESPYTGRVIETATPTIDHVIDITFELSSKFLQHDLQTVLYVFSNIPETPSLASLSEMFVELFNRQNTTETPAAALSKLAKFREFNFSIVWTTGRRVREGQINAQNTFSIERLNETLNLNHFYSLDSTLGSYVTVNFKTPAHSRGALFQYTRNCIQQSLTIYEKV